MTKENCPICQSPNVESCLMDARGNRERFTCHNCGSFEIPRFQAQLIKDVTEKDRLYRHKCAVVMLERNLKGLNDTVQLRYDGNEKGLVFATTGERLEDFYPISFYEKLERGFYNLVRITQAAPWKRFSIGEINYNAKTLLFLDAPGTNANSALDFYCEEGWLTRYEYKGAVNSVMYRITSKGMQRFDSALANNSSNVFLAMWFGADKDRKYREAVMQAVVNAGYHLHVVNDEHYNGFIMDKVINLINDSAFVIADITAAPESIQGDNVLQGVRGGVYWEAGYATGQKKQVILTCLDDREAEKRIHFDLQQYNQIRWHIENERVVTSDGLDFSEALTQRILATVGKGRKHHDEN